MTEALLTLPTLRVEGSPEQLGAAHGESERELIQRFVDQRLAAVEAYFSERGASGAALLTEMGARCLRIAREWDPEGTREHDAIAQAAGVASDALYAVANMTDVRDVLLLPSAADEEGCTSLLLPGAMSAAGHVLAGQTWDLNPQDLDYVLAVHRVPTEGPETWSVGCTGCLSLMGMNEHGLAVGTTNIKVRGCRPGVGYLSLLHRLIRARDRAEAAELLTAAPRAAAHTYWVADADGALELEAAAGSLARRDAGAEALARSNHCLSPEHAALQGEPTTSSSERRLARMLELLGAGGHTPESLKAAFADRADGVDSIARFPEDAQGTATNSCLVVEPKTRGLWACKGPSQRGAWVKLEFERG